MSKCLLILIVLLTCEYVSAKELRAVIDPTRPLGYRASSIQKSPLKLQAIFWGQGRKEAIVNGQSVKEGDSVQGKRIVQIKPQAIVYENNGGRYTLLLRPSIFK